MRPRGVGGLRRAFVGRDEEMEVLERVYAEIEDQREPQLVTILGDAGVGKTRIVREFWDWLGDRSPETLRRTGRCLSYGQGITYWPLAEVLKGHLGIFESAPPALVLERLGSREILGLTLGLDVARGLHPLAARDRFQDAWVEFLEEIIAERPAVVLIEDVHWGEEQLLDLLERAVRDTRGPLLLIATARPEFLERRPGWGARIRATTLELEALSSEDAVRMLDGLLGGTLPAGLREVVVQRAEGNPFFVEELLGTLIDRRLLEPQNGSWRLAKARRARLHAAFARWLERTGEERDKYAPLLAHHYAEAVRPDDSDLAWAGEEGEFALLRARALAWLRRAAELAIGRFEIDDGLTLLHRALALEPDQADQAALWREIGRANVFKFDGEAFWTAMLSSLEGTTDQATVADTYSVLAFHTATRAAMWKRRPDRELIEGWIERARELSEPDAPARARALIARTYFDPEGSGEAAREASDLADRLGDIELRSWAWGARSEVAYSRGEYHEAFDWVRHRFAIVPTLTDPDHIALIYMFGLPACLATGRFQEARGISKAHDEVTGNLTPHHRMHAAWLLLAVEQAGGYWDAVRNLTPRAESAVAANIATPCSSNVSSLLVCALASVHLGDDQEARRLERSALGLGMEGYSFDALYVEIAIARGDLGEVERRLNEWSPEGFLDIEGSIARLNALVALERRAEIEEGAPAFLKPGMYVEPFALRALGYARGDNELIQQAIERFDSMGLDWHTAETRSLMSPG